MACTLLLRGVLALGAVMVLVGSPGCLVLSSSGRSAAAANASEGTKPEVQSSVDGAELAAGSVGVVPTVFSAGVGAGDDPLLRSLQLQERLVEWTAKKRPSLRPRRLLPPSLGAARGDLEALLEDYRTGAALDPASLRRVGGAASVSYLAFSRIDRLEQASHIAAVGSPESLACLSDATAAASWTIFDCHTGEAVWQARHTVREDGEPVPVQDERSECRAREAPLEALFMELAEALPTQA